MYDPSSFYKLIEYTKSKIPELENVEFIESDMFLYMPDDKIIEYAVIIDEYELKR